MPANLEKAMSERGVLATPPTEPLETYEKFWERTVRWLAAAERAPGMVREYGAEKARKLLNLAVGQPAFNTDDRLVPQLGRSGTYGFVLLPGGCHWALEKARGGQCSFCEFQEIVDLVAGDLPFNHEEFMALFKAGFATMLDATMVNVFTAGSFLAPGEIPPETQTAIARMVAEAAVPSILRIESRVQHMHEEYIKPLTDIMTAHGKTLDIAIGFETLDDDLRNKVLRKGMGRAGFVDGVRIAKSLGARVSVYVILMPVAMEEGFAIKECIDSIRFAFDTGADEVLLQARYSQDADARCPKLWSIVKVLRETVPLGPVMLGKWEGELPEPKVWPTNCPACTDQVMTALGRWRADLQPSALAEENLPACACRAEWELAAAKMNPPSMGGRRMLPVIP